MSSPFPDKTVEAVGACTRALGRLEFADAAVAQSDAATLSGLRAFGDRLALRARFHDISIHQRSRPPKAPDSDLFDALELARLDTIGVQWLQGVAKNLLSHPGVEPDGVRWLAFEALSSLAAPKEKADLVRRLRQQLPVKVADGLTSLSAVLRDQERFSEEAARWVRSAVPHIPKADAPPAGALPFELRKKVNVRTLPRRGDPGATSAPLKKRQEGTQDSEGSAGSGAITRGGTSGEAYRPYTTAHDRIVNAADARRPLRACRVASQARGGARIDSPRCGASREATAACADGSPDAPLALRSR